MKKTYSIRLDDIDIRILDELGKALQDEFKQKGISFKVTRSGIISAVLFDYARSYCEDHQMALSDFIYWADEQ